MAWRVWQASNNVKCHQVIGAAPVVAVDDQSTAASMRFSACAVMLLLLLLRRLVWRIEQPAACALPFTHHRLARGMQCLSSECGFTRLAMWMPTIVRLLFWAHCTFAHI
jgi:hypothetical protein